MSGIKGGIMLGGPNARYQRVHGDIVASYQYVNDERAMVLWPQFRKNVTAFVVCDSAAWKYDDPVYLAKQARHVANLWGEAPDSQRWFQIAKIIHEGLADLIRLKPKPVIAHTMPTIGEMELMVAGRRVAGAEMTMPTADEMAHYERDGGTLH